MLYIRFPEGILAITEGVYPFCVICIICCRASPDSSVGIESTCNAGDAGSIPELGRSPGERIDYPLQYSGLENSMDCIVHALAESDMTKQL